MADLKEVKNEVNFARDDEGHQLNESAAAIPQTVQSQTYPQSSGRQSFDNETEVRAAAAEAAQQRLQHQLSRQKSGTSSSLTADSVRRQAQRELEQEKVLKDEYQKAVDLKEYYFGNRQISTETVPIVDYKKLFFKCPDIFGDNVCLTYDELQQRIESTLKSQLNSEPIITATRLFLTCNQKDLDKLNIGKEIICKYFDNIISNPNEDKYRRIRLQNKIYLEKVFPLKYARELLQATGFISSDDNESIIYQEHSFERLQLAHDTLMNSKPIKIQLDKNLKIFQPTREQLSIPRIQLLPQDPLFYQITTDELLREKQRQKDLLEKEQMLRTKAMRQRDEKSSLNIQYKYTILRIRMPDEIILQVIFPCNDLLSSLFEYLRSYCLVYNTLPFTLTSMTDRRIYSSQDEQSITFNQCNLVPTAFLSFRWNDQALREIKEQADYFLTNIYIKPEVLYNAARL
ncbi:unnamed protein product [Rotaria sordida]|uniref:UBX domain-containing protein n=1 Tax=Rotaria sordida TaxID=392033 RepID=A0A819EEH6_9BILA|nr:unnamed protein product [Rotaria sordida]CAF3790058.1 unnamed protein product [Rotaria sordida]CAF3849230.1 unnamed protein product [Rotaria sordida]